MNRSRTLGCGLRRAALLFSVFGLGACQAWVPVDHDAAAPMPSDDVRVRMVDGSWIVLRNVELRRDSLFGENPGCRWNLALGRAPGRAWCGGVALARSDVASLHVQAPSPFRTNVAILVFGLVWCALMIACLELLTQGRNEQLSHRPRRMGSRIESTVRGAPGD